MNYKIGETVWFPMPQGDGYYGVGTGKIVAINLVEGEFFYDIADDVFEDVYKNINLKVLEETKKYL